MRVLYAGESHLDAIIAVIEGFPSGFYIDGEKINRDLFRRQWGYGRSDRMKIESDGAQILSGVISGMTIGSPITLLIPNRDNRRENWSSEKVQTVPRPGHADLAGAIKYNLLDLRLVAERASARQTAAWVAAGSIFKQFLEEFGIQILGFVESIGGIKWQIPPDPFSLADKIESSPFRTGDANVDKEMQVLVDEIKERGDTLGGTFLAIARGCPPGLGSYTHPDIRLDAALAGAFMAIPSVKGVEIGAGFSSSFRLGSKVQDLIDVKDGKIARKTNNAGGIEGGVSNGEDIIVRGAAKPIPTLGTPLPSIDIQTGLPAPSPKVRADVCVLPAISVIGEAVMARVLTEFFLERFGKDNMRQVRERFEEDKRNWGHFIEFH